MSGAVFSLITNMAIAALFASSYLAVGCIFHVQRSVLWFAAAYGIGMLTPVTELLIPLTPWPGFFDVLNYVSFGAGLLTLTIALAVFYRQRPPWGLLGLFGGAGVAICLLIQGVVPTSTFFGRGHLFFQMAYQAPFSLASFTAGWVVVRAKRRKLLDISLAVVLAILGLHFLIKPFFAVAYCFGSAIQGYITNPYALISQTSSGVLLMAMGLLVLLVTLGGVIGEARHDAVTDPLSQLLNRRGFDNAMKRAMAAAAQSGAPLSVVMLDIDFFKSVNDTYGHQTGDAEILALSDLLRSLASCVTTIGRVGGEEFALLVADTPPDQARQLAEKIRRGVEGLAAPDLPAITISCGVAEVRADETIREAMLRADAALYRAKNSGRNRVCLDGETDGDNQQDGNQRRLCTSE